MTASTLACCIVLQYDQDNPTCGCSFVKRYCHLSHNWVLRPEVWKRVRQICDIRQVNLSHACITYGVASASRFDKIISLFCKRALIQRQYSAKETYNLIDSADRSHLICKKGGGGCFRNRELKLSQPRSKAFWHFKRTKSTSSKTGGLQKWGLVAASEFGSRTTVQKLWIVDLIPTENFPQDTTCRLQLAGVFDYVSVSIFLSWVANTQLERFITTLSGCHVTTTKKQQGRTWHQLSW